MTAKTDTRCAYGCCVFVLTTRGVERFLICKYCKGLP